MFSVFRQVGISRCAQCFELLAENLHYEVNKRYYCEYDFKQLYAPTCVRCGMFETFGKKIKLGANFYWKRKRFIHCKYITGRVIKVSIDSWHPECLLCDLCQTPLDSKGIWRYAGRLYFFEPISLQLVWVLCSNCKKQMKEAGEKMCARCKLRIEPGKSFRYQHEDIHGYHLNCTKCQEELDENARVLENKPYCSKCYDQLCPTCAACKRPIDNERSVIAVRRHWHLEHFRCAKCERPLHSSKYIEKKDKAYCEDCCIKFTDACYKCGSCLVKQHVTLFKKGWCTGCYSCSACDRTLTPKSKVFELDMRPICKKCYDRFPKNLKERLMSR
ncbi:unnamed protein product [Enterobius vermicularis]|uniref:LIM zinc-binding domain-containing protein n=1 Tax=Enterobius vermicularis TaxID=51028 RepID=A0A0N4V193_ENTVE|nr:unnamed protein product [Enterobius vermicularis]